MRMHRKKQSKDYNHRLPRGNPGHFFVLYITVYILVYIIMYIIEKLNET